MKEIRIWAIDGATPTSLEVCPVEAVDRAETERLLEEIIVRKPDLLLPDLKLVGRQTETPGGPLDLLGVDGDGRLVVFELKRGTLTREAVAQVVDYASYLHELDAEQLSIHISERTGHAGIAKIDNFLSWYAEQFARSFSNAQTPRLVLVGLGVDETARRMVAFMAKSDLDVSLITFYGFKQDGRTLLARQLDIEATPPVGNRVSSKASNLGRLREHVDRLGVGVFYYTVAKFLQDRLSAAYEWPNAGGFTYYLPEITETGNQSNRAYVSLYLSDSKPGMVQVTFQPRAIEAATRARPEIRAEIPKRLKVTPTGVASTWVRSADEVTQSGFFEEMCLALVDGWKTRADPDTLGPEVAGTSNGTEEPG